MKWAIALGSLSALAAAGCHDKDKDRGTCITTVRVGRDDVARCIVNEPRVECTSNGARSDVEFTEEDPAAGQVRCKAAGYDTIDPQATSCEGGYTGTFDMRRGGTVPADMITSALNNACALHFTKR